MLLLFAGNLVGVSFVFCMVGTYFHILVVFFFQ